MFSSVPHLRSIRRSNTAPVQPTAFASFPSRDCSCCVVLRQRIPLRRASQGNFDLSIGTHEQQQTTSHHQTAPDPSCTLPKPSTSSSVFCFVFFSFPPCARRQLERMRACVCVRVCCRSCRPACIQCLCAALSTSAYKYGFYLLVQLYSAHPPYYSTWRRERVRPTSEGAKMYCVYCIVGGVGPKSNSRKKKDEE